jgi:hypothetical protein
MGIYDGEVLPVVLVSWKIGMRVGEKRTSKNHFI